MKEKWSSKSSSLHRFANSSVPHIRVRISTCTQQRKLQLPKHPPHEDMSVARLARGIYLRFTTCASHVNEGVVHVVCLTFDWVAVRRLCKQHTKLILIYSSLTVYRITLSSSLINILHNFRAAFFLAAWKHSDCAFFLRKSFAFDLNFETHATIGQMPTYDLLQDDDRDWNHLSIYIVAEHQRKLPIVMMV